MNLEATEILITKLLKTYLSNETWHEELSQEQVALLFDILKKHDLTHIAGVVFSKSGASRDKYAPFIKAQFLAISRYERGRYVKEQIYRVFENAGISFLPLKGAVICDYYPEPWHRTSCDIDILINKADIHYAVNILKEKLSFSYSGKSEHDVSLYSPDEVHLELHYDFHETNISVADAWSSARLIEGKQYHYVLAPEVFILHHIAHIAKHFKYGGCGLRFFVDLWIILHKMHYDEQKLKHILKHKGLSCFADSTFRLIEFWFGNGTKDTVISEMSDYIFNSSIYGNVENKAVISQIKSKSHFNYVLKRLFIPYEALKYKYPILEKHRWLLPVCQLHRWIRLLAKGNSSFNELKSIDEHKKIAIEKLLSDLNLL